MSKTKKLKKFDIGKTRFGLIHPIALEQISKVFMIGAEKYGDWNYLFGTNWSRYYDACQRHLNAYWSREDNDKDSGLPHLAHAGCCVIILLIYQLLGIGKDNRPPQIKKK